MIKVLFCGARYLGMECLKELVKRPEVKIIGAIVPRRGEKVWWKDVVDEETVKKLNIGLLDWKDVNKLKDIDLVFSVLHGPIFKEPFISRVKYGVINLHPAPLPYYRGCNSYAHAIMNSEKKYGVTLHYVNEGIDTGPVIEVSWLPILKNDTGKSLYDKSQKLALKLFKKQLPKIIKAALKGGKVRSKNQNDKIARYYPRTSLSNKQADFNLPYKKIYNFVRALQFAPFEPAHIIVSGKKVHLSVFKGKIIIKNENN